MNFWDEYEKIFHGRWPAPYRALPEGAAEAALLYGGMLPCSECVEVCEDHGRPTAQARFFHELRDHEDGMALHGSVMDMYWSCPHAEVLYGPYDFPCYVYEDGERFRTWADILEEAELTPEALAKAAAKEAALKAAVVLDKSAVDYLVQHEKKKQLDEVYAEASVMDEWSAKIEEKMVDAKRSGKSWSLGRKLICKYGAHNHRGAKGKWEKELVYSFINPLLGARAKHIYTECWFWEYVDPKTGKKVSKHVCNCLHPGQAGWEDEWLWNQECAEMYDRFDDWYCYYYDAGLKQWMWDDKRTLRDADRTRKTREELCSPNGEQNRARKEKVSVPTPTPASASGRDQKREGVMGDDKTSPKQKREVKKPASGRFASAAKGDDYGWTTVAPAQDARVAKVSTKTVWEQKARK